jgi:DNA-binding response OmpR family regulator
MIFDPDPVCVVAMSAGKLRSDLEAELSIDGYEVRCADSIAAVETRLTPCMADVLLVGSMDDPAAACALLRGLRAGRLCDGQIAPGLPAIAIVPDCELASLLRAFDCGADDVVAHPIRYAELRARMAALLARVRRERGPQVERIGELVFDLAGRTVMVGDTPVELTSKEWELVALLASAPTRVFTKQELLREVWQTDFMGMARTLDSHACRLRAKLADAGARNYVLNVWGVGYRLMDAATLAVAGLTATAGLAS